MLKICPCCKYVSNLYQTITFTSLLRINTYLANICICPHFSRQRKCNANLELQIYHIFAPFANISKSVFSSSVMSHHPGVLILLQVKKKQSVGCRVVRLPGNSIVRCSQYAPELLVRRSSFQVFGEKTQGQTWGPKYKGRLAEFWDTT